MFEIVQFIQISKSITCKQVFWWRRCWDASAPLFCFVKMRYFVSVVGHMVL